MNDMLNAIRTRRSVKRYKPDLPDEASIRQVAEAGAATATRFTARPPCLWCWPTKTAPRTSMTAALLLEK